MGKTTLCKDCIFWGVENPTGNHPYEKDSDILRECGSPKFVYKHAWPESGDVPIDGLRFEDGEGCQASVGTGPEFGCIHAQRREVE